MTRLPLPELTHCSAALPLDYCIRCGTSDFSSYKCRCGFWVNECAACQLAKASEAKKVYIAQMAEEIAKKIEFDFFHAPRVCP